VRFKALFLCALLAGLQVSAPGAPAAENAAENKGGGSLLFYHWWTAPSEAAALNALVKIFKTRYPEVTVNAVPVPDGGGASKLFPVVRSRVNAGKAPAAFQMHSGYGGQPFFEAGLLSPVDGIWAAEDLEKVIPPVIRDMSRIEGHYYSIPLSVHRINVVWYNKALLDRSRIDPATLTTWTAFFKAAETLRAAGVRSPIQLGEAWTAGMAFQGVVASQGMDVYEDWVNGRITAADDSRMIAALNVFAQYLSYVNPDHAKLGWDLAVKRIIGGDGAFYLMGDWANGEFRLAGANYGKDYGTIPLPGTGGTYGVTIDTFLHPRETASVANADRWLRLASSREGQDAFNSLKGSISPRSDADVTRYDPYQRSAIADFRAARTIYPSLDNAVPDAFRTRLNDIIEAFTEDTNVSKAATALASATVKASGKYSRTWALSGKKKP
jgi:glucose/mannose transport system substrate-binding protein